MAPPNGRDGKAMSDMSVRQSRQRGLQQALDDWLNWTDEGIEVGVAEALRSVGARVSALGSTAAGEVGEEGRRARVVFALGVVADGELLVGSGEAETAAEPAYGWGNDGVELWGGAVLWRRVRGTWAVDDRGEALILLAARRAVDDLVRGLSAEQERAVWSKLGDVWAIGDRVGVRREVDLSGGADAEVMTRWDAAHTTDGRCGEWILTATTASGEQFDDALGVWR